MSWPIVQDESDVVLIVNCDVQASGKKKHEYMGCSMEMGNHIKEIDVPKDHILIKNLKLQSIIKQVIRL